LEPAGSYSALCREVATVALNGADSSTGEWTRFCFKRLAERVGCSATFVAPIEG
jgi:hypothetical protein